MKANVSQLVGILRLLVFRHPKCGRSILKGIADVLKGLELNISPFTVSLPQVYVRV